MSVNLCFIKSFVKENTNKITRWRQSLVTFVHYDEVHIALFVETMEVIYVCLHNLCQGERKEK
jgi:hypothetical protein